VQCPFISEDEVAALTDFLRTQGSPQYHDAILREASEDDAEVSPGEEMDARYDEAVRIVAETQRCSTSWLQRKMGIGYNRAAKIVEAMETSRGRRPGERRAGPRSPGRAPVMSARDRGRSPRGRSPRRK
jgi:DNA segregation ATPase FtsK/SpoIIIE-like protein